MLDIRRLAIRAAGNWEVDAAWPHIVAFVSDQDADKPLPLAEIEADTCIRPEEAMELPDDLTDSDDEDMVEAVYEALDMAEDLSDIDAYWQSNSFCPRCFQLLKLHDSLKR